jgi:pyruvate kinase
MSDQVDSATEITSGTKLSVLRKVASSPLLDHTAEVLGAKSNWPKAKIICTIGPASRDPENLARLYECGMRWYEHRRASYVQMFSNPASSMRLNFSHGSYEYHAGSIVNLRSIMAGSKRACSIMLDTKGPEIRSGKVKGGSVNLKQGQRVVLTWDEKFKDVEYDGSDGGKLYHDYTRITDSLVVGDCCLVDDGLIGLEVVAVDGNDLVTRCATFSYKKIHSAS